MFGEALSLALANRDHMGYPWIELQTETIELSASDDVGEKAALDAGATVFDAGLTVRLTWAQASIARLDEIADDVTRLVDAGIPNADVIWMTEPDQKNNRVVITVSESNPELMSALASRYGTDLIAVRVWPSGPAAAANRDSDYPPFWGGAYITTSTGKACTTGFSWTVGGQSAMLTAAHCISTGGTVSYPSYSNVGAVTSLSEENWNNTNGTQYYTGQGVYRGDVALIRYSGYSSSPRIYSGGAHTSTNAAVSKIASRESELGDAACVNGVTTGGWCGVVTGTHLNIWYAGTGPNVWARHMVRAEAPGWTCPTSGDSGAPVYRWLDDGKVAAVGIFSGYFPTGLVCVVYFTDIWDAYWGLPGSLKVN